MSVLLKGGMMNDNFVIIRVSQRLARALRNYNQNSKKLLGAPSVYKIGGCLTLLQEAAQHSAIEDEECKECGGDEYLQPCSKCKKPDYKYKDEPIVLTAIEYASLSQGEIEVNIRINDRVGHCFVSKEFWEALGEKAGWIVSG